MARIVGKPQTAAGLNKFTSEGSRIDGASSFNAAHFHFVADVLGECT